MTEELSSLTWKQVLAASVENKVHALCLVLSYFNTGQRVASAEHSNHLTCLQVHPVEPYYFLTGSKNVILCWDKRSTMKPVKLLKYKDNFGQVLTTEEEPPG